MIYNNDIITFTKEKDYRYIGQSNVWYDDNDNILTDIEIYSPNNITIEDDDIRLIAIKKRTTSDKLLVTYEIYINPDILPVSTDPHHDHPDNDNVIISFKEGDENYNIFSVYKYIEDIDNRIYTENGLVAPNVPYFLFVRTNTPLRVLGYKVLVSALTSVSAREIHSNIFS